ncbi:MAG: DUF4147 domain-containing protein, partial [Rhodospirillaceae bacterium]|nr:DUF4147 domain-containing protein [Rhodospirillaceae bacterium]
PGDDPATVASGPTVPDPTYCTDAIDILAEYGIMVPASILAHLKTVDTETPKPGDPAFARDHVAVIARARDALDAAADAARSNGWTVDDLGDAIEGEARDVAQSHGNQALALARETGALARGTGAPPCLLLSGGETSVTLTGSGGSGGRNTEYLLALGLALDGHPDIWAIACDTDGLDGNSAAAGAILRPDSLDRARSLGLNPRQMLDEHRSATLFAALGDLVHTAPTRTNVNDFRAILIDT